MGLWKRRPVRRGGQLAEQYSAENPSHATTWGIREYALWKIIARSAKGELIVVSLQQVAPGYAAMSLVIFGHDGGADIISAWPLLSLLNPR